MPESQTLEEKEKLLQEAYDAFMERMRGLEHDQLEIMKRVIGTLEQEEIQKLLDTLKR